MLRLVSSCWVGELVGCSHFGIRSSVVVFFRFVLFRVIRVYGNASHMNCLLLCFSDDAVERESCALRGSIVGLAFAINRRVET